MFGLLKANKYIDKEAEVIGWYRRAPVPYIEIKEMYVEGRKVKCYSYIAQIISAILLLGILGFFGVMGLLVI
jgi:heat shock protein HtpX